MNKVFDKLKPVFEAIAANKYISAIRDGFIACMPIIIFSSIFMMVAYVPNAWGFYWPDNVTNTLMVAYNYSMGLLALFVAGTTAKNLTDSKNLELPKTNQINPVAVIVASEISFVILSILPLKTGVDLTYMGTQGLICAYIVGLIVPNIYYVCIKNNVTIKLPEQVPGNIAQSFKDLFCDSLLAFRCWLQSGNGYCIATLDHSSTFAAFPSQRFLSRLSPDCWRDGFLLVLWCPRPINCSAGCCPDYDCEYSS